MESNQEGKNGIFGAKKDAILRLGAFMLKVLVLDSGWGGEMFADYLEEELMVVEVERLIDWRQGAYAECGYREIRERAEKNLAKYIGKKDVIVLASYALTVAALSYLREKYPWQKFVGFNLCLSQKLKRLREGKHVLVLTSLVVKDSMEYSDERGRLKRFKLTEKCCQDWEKKVDDGEFSREFLAKNLAKTKNVDAVLLYGANFLDFKDEFERIYGWGVQVVDGFAGVLREICQQLKLKGLDGKRSK